MKSLSRYDTCPIDTRIQPGCPKCMECNHYVGEEIFLYGVKGCICSYEDNNKKLYKIYLDDFTEQIFYKMEEISHGLSGHECEIVAFDKETAVNEILEKLKPFIFEQLEESSDRK